MSSNYTEEQVSQQVLLEEALAAIDRNELDFFTNLSQDLSELHRAGELLIWALELDRREIALSLLDDNNVPLDATNDENASCVILATKKNNLNCLERILSKCQIDINALDSYGWSALMYSCYYGFSHATRMLLLAGAQTNIYDNDHISSLIWASGRGHRDCVAHLLQIGRTKVNEVDKLGWTALIWACRKGFTEIASLLLRAGANVDSSGMFGWSPLLVSVLNDHVETMKLLLQYKPNVNTSDSNRYTPLIAACKEGKLEMVRLLLKARAFANLSDSYGHTALIHATKGGHFEIVDLLLRHHADVDHHGQDKKTALFWAVDKGNGELVDRLLQAKPNLELLSKEGESCLMRAVKLRKYAIIRQLLSHQAKTTTVDRNGDTILHVAVKLQSATLAHLILSNPKNLHLVQRLNKSKQTPLMLDRENSTPVLSNLIEVRKSGTKISYRLSDKAFQASQLQLENAHASVNLSLQADDLNFSQHHHSSFGSTIVGRLASVFNRQHQTQLQVLA